MCGFSQFLKVGAKALMAWYGIYKFIMILKFVSVFTYLTVKIWRATHYLDV
jgi:hypothetical protein